jgi:2-methylcitrate dehydratase
MDSPSIKLSRTSNQARELGQFAIDFMANKFPSPNEFVFEQIELFHLDSVCCAASALALQTNAPTVLREEALCYPINNTGSGAFCFGSSIEVAPEKAILANCAAVREWDANGTNFGFNPQENAIAGEFGHNDFYPVAVAAAQSNGLDGFQTTLGMLLIDEIRGRLAERFSLKNHKIDHVLHGGIASVIVYAAMVGANPDQIESALGLLIAHYIPYRAIRSGKQLSDSKGASAALTSEMAILSVQRAMRGFVGPADIFRNQQAIFCLSEPPDSPDESPFDLTLTTSGDNFAILDMHFKLGIYEHQSAGAIQAIINLLEKHPQMIASGILPSHIEVTIYEPAYSIICDPAKRDPKTRQTADHSMLFIVAAILEKAYRIQSTFWQDLMLLPEDYTLKNIHNKTIRELMDKVVVIHGGATYDTKYPQGIPTSIRLHHTDVGQVDSGLIMYPLGHAQSDVTTTRDILNTKIQRLASLGLENPNALMARLNNIRKASPEDIRTMYSFDIRQQ